VTINNATNWDGPAKFSFAMAILLFVRDATLITLYIIKKFIDNTGEPLIRPQAEGKHMSRIEMEASVNITNYLLDQKDSNIDELGNTALHEVTKFDNPLDEVETQVYASP
jgi:hypothetical protein